MSVVDASELGAELRYTIDRAQLPSRLAHAVVELAPDDATLAFLHRQHGARHRRLRWAARSVLRTCCSDFTVNGLLDTYRLHLLSADQWRTLLGTGRGGRLLDVGAGVGGVTREIAPSFEHVTAVETSASLVRRLREEGFVAHRADLATDAVPDGPYDAIALLNVLDRCERPRTLLANLVESLVPRGRAVVSMPLPYRPMYYAGPRPAEPRERLPVGRGTWEGQAARLAERVLAPLGLDVEVLARAPYLSEGDRHTSFYELDAVVLVCRRAC